jgi:hypothetical protein
MSWQGLVLGIAGAVVGARFGGATGAQIGFLIGSLAGALLFPDSAKGPRLDDLRITTSAYGQPMALCYGTWRKAGNVIWSEEIEEKKKSSRQGLVGPKVKEYTYFLTFAVAFCNNEQADLIRIWANGTLVYDVSGIVTYPEQEMGETYEDYKERRELFRNLYRRGADGFYRMRGLSFVFYPGSETQEVDPTIEAVVGVGQTPAYRGQCYIVFNRLPLAEFGNRMPNIECEIAQTVVEVGENNSVDLALPREGGTLDTANNLFFAVDWIRQLAFAIDTAGDVSLSGIRRLNIETMEEDRQRLNEDAFAQINTEDFNAATVKVRNSVGCVLPVSGNLFVQLETSAGTNNQPFAIVDGNTLREIARNGVPDTGSLTFNRETERFGVASGCAPIVANGSLGPQEFAIVRNDNGSIGVFLGGTMPFCIWSTDSDENAFVVEDVKAVCGGKTGTGWGYGWATVGSDYSPSPQSAPLTIMRIKVPYLPQRDLKTELLNLAIADYFSPRSAQVASAMLIIKTVIWNYTDSQLRFETLGTYDPGDLIPGETALQTAGRGLVYDETHAAVMFHARADSNSANYIISVSDLDGSVRWRTEYQGGEPNNNSTWSHSRVQNDTFSFLDLNGDGHSINTRTGELLVDNVDFPGGVATGALGAYDSRSDSFVGLTGDTASVWARWWFSRRDRQPVTLASIVTDICVRCGLSAGDINVTDLVDDDVTGYLVVGQNSGRNAISPLSLVYFFDGVESDFVLKFPQRGGAVARTIDTDDMLRDNDGHLVTESRRQEIELPARLSLSYMNYNRDYEINVQAAKRILEPASAMESREQADIQTTIIMDANQAAQFVERALFATWIERMSYGHRVPWTHLDLDPTDVIAITTDTETLERVRISTIDVGDDLHMELSELREEEGEWESTAVGDAGAIPDMPVGATRCKLLLLDCPLLEDVDEQFGRAGAPLYYLMGGYGFPGWTAATLYKSETGALSEYEIAGRETNEMIWGVAVDTLGDPVSPWMTDTVNTLTVEFQAGDTSGLVSITTLQLLAGMNRAAVLKANGEVEIIHYKNVTDNGDGTFTFDTFLRARRGTDTLCYNHLPGEIFLPLPDYEDDAVSVDYVPLKLEEIRQSRFYKGVGDRQLFEDAETVGKISEGRALMPYAPANIHTSLSGNDVVFTWFRRDRLGAEIELDDLGGDILLSEDEEVYEIDVLDEPGGDIVRTIIEIPGPTYTYTDADQTTDGLEAEAQLTVRIYQISGQVGRGFAQEITLDVR